MAFTPVKLGEGPALGGMWSCSWLYLSLYACLMFQVCSLCPAPLPSVWAFPSVGDEGLTPWRERDEQEQGNNLCQGTTRKRHRYPSESAWGGLSRKQGDAQQGPALSERWLLSLLAALSAPGLLSVTSLLRNSRRQAEMGAPVPGPCRSALFRK